jgi:hypothetical protein
LICNKEKNGKKKYLVYTARKITTGKVTGMKSYHNTIKSNYPRLLAMSTRKHREPPKVFNALCLGLY